MFVSTTPAEDTDSVSEATVEAALDASVASNANDKPRTGGAMARDAPDDKVPSAGCSCFVTPDPLFASNPRSPVIYMDPARVALYRSLGLVVGLAVRAGVPLPSLRLSPTWWMLVANEASALLMDALTVESNTVGMSTSAEGGERTPGGTASEAEAAEGGRPRPAGLDETAPISGAVANKGGASNSELDGVLAALERIGEAGAGKDKLEQVLADARFVAPLSSGQMVELVPGGERSQEQGVGTRATGSVIEARRRNGLLRKTESVRTNNSFVLHSNHIG